MTYLGGFDITDISWAGRNAVAVTIDRGGKYSDKLLQLYAGRRLIGTTSDPSENVIIGQVPAGSACPLGVLVRDAADRLDDWGSHLDLRAWNVYRIQFAAPVDPPADIHHFDIVAGAAPGDPYDSTNIVARIPFSGAATYSYVLPSFPVRGDWQIAVIARDNAQPLGNAGSENSLTIPTIIFPWDFVIRSDGRRYLPTVADGVLTIDYQDGTPPLFP